MNGFFCCLRKSSRDRNDAESEIKEPFQPLTPHQEVSCCCFRNRRRNSVQRTHYLFRKSPKLCDAAVDTEIDFGIVLHDLERVDVENFDEKDHKFASLQFDSTKPGKVKYIEGSQVFYVEVRDKRLNPHRRNSSLSEKSMSDEDELRMDSDLSTDVLWETKSEGRRRCMEPDKKQLRKNPLGKTTGAKTPVIIYMPSKWSPTPSLDSLSDKKYPNRPYLHEIDEEPARDTPYKEHKRTDSKDAYSIGGGQISPVEIEPEDDPDEKPEAVKRASSPSSSESVQSSIQDYKNKSATENDHPDLEGSGFADVSSLSVDDITTSNPITAPIAESTESNEQSTMFTEENDESYFALESATPIEQSLMEDPSRLLVVDHTTSMIFIKPEEAEIRDLNSCPEVTQHQEPSYLKLPSPSHSDTGNAITESEDTETANKDSECSEKSAFSVETQTSEREVNIDCKTAEQYKPSVVSVYTETDCGHIDCDANEGRTVICTERVSTSIITTKKSPANNNSDSSSSPESDSECSFGESESSSNSEDFLKKDGPSNSSDSFCSTCSSSPKSVHKRNRKSHADKDGKTKSSSSSSLEGSSSSSDTSCTLSSSTSSCSSSSTSKHSPKEGDSFGLPICNG